MRFVKARGLTASEKVLADLCEKSFLSLWSYPHLYRKSGKELTDLLVVFGEDVILFSDKSCAFPDNGDADLDWQRWFRRSITKSAEQITQAEDWIKRQPSRVSLDAKATQPLHVPLPPADRTRVTPRLHCAWRCRTVQSRDGYATWSCRHQRWTMRSPSRFDASATPTPGFMSSMTRRFRSSSPSFRPSPIFSVKAIIQLQTTLSRYGRGRLNR
jgi:hypothetical protein